MGTGAAQSWTACALMSRTAQPRQRSLASPAKAKNRVLAHGCIPLAISTRRFAQLRPGGYTLPVRALPLVSLFLVLHCAGARKPSPTEPRPAYDCRTNLDCRSGLRCADGKCLSP